MSTKTINCSTAYQQNSKTANEIQRLPEDARRTPVDLPVYTSDAIRSSLMSLSTLKLGSWRWQAFVYAKRSTDRSARVVYRRRCLNETHAKKVAADMALKFQQYAERTGTPWEERIASRKKVSQ